MAVEVGPPAEDAVWVLVLIGPWTSPPFAHSVRSPAFDDTLGIGVVTTALAPFVAVGIRRDREQGRHCERNAQARSAALPSMETTRHFTATLYIVNDGATALHAHPGLGIRLPPGGHVDRDELPHETALREAREETGLDPTLLTDHREIGSETARSLPRPRHLMLADVNRFGDRVGHQHIDHVYFATVETRRLEPADGEEPADAWGWYTTEGLRAADVDDDVRELGIEAIEAAAVTD